MPHLTSTPPQTRVLEYSIAPLPGLWVRVRDITCTRLGMWKVGGNHCLAPLAGVNRCMVLADEKHCRGLPSPVCISSPGTAAGCEQCSSPLAALIACSKSACQPRLSDFCSFSPLNCPISIEYPGLNPFLLKIPGKVFLFS